MSSPAIPWSIIEAGLAQLAPAVVPLLAQHLTGLGFDLGPMTPDVAGAMKVVDAEVDGELAARAKAEAKAADETYSDPEPAPAAPEAPPTPKVSP